MVDKKVDIRTAEDARAHFEVGVLDLQAVLYRISSLSGYEWTAIINPNEKLAPGVKEQLEGAGFTVEEEPDQFGFAVTLVHWGNAKRPGRKESGRSHPGLDDLWVDNAKQAREIAKANSLDLTSILECVYYQARNGRMSVEVPSLFDSPLERELNERGFTVRHENTPCGIITEISW